MAQKKPALPKVDPAKMKKLKSDWKLKQKSLKSKSPATPKVKKPKASMGTKETLRYKTASRKD
jgi:hypothetical protein